VAVSDSSSDMVRNRGSRSYDSARATRVNRSLTTAWTAALDNDGPEFYRATSALAEDGAAADLAFVWSFYRELMRYRAVRERKGVARR
jgi:hypothetical protein